ncbi:tetratricopeptide repeat protein [Zoogloea sp. LCSB751]|uniref:tetratricopeptide repeat protein n=1 Tax=Zoogloea sp. LCSB751 TaxID=1965277 RepID=UPI0009A51D10|nr:tetratricopeptide repeat protein [Zoogloea sp. LCSB751]
MRSIFPSKRNTPRLAAALLAGAAALGGIAWASRTPTPTAAELAQLQILAGPGRQDAALARLTNLAEGGTADARRTLGLALLSRGDHDGTGLQWLRRAAQEGDTDAAFQLGKLYSAGTAGVPADAVRAFAWFSAAGKAGHAGAAYYLGIAWRDGYGVKTDHAEAARWLRRAADAGIAAAQFLLANAYREGDGVPRDDIEAVRLYSAAAEQDHPEACQTLAMAYLNGELGLQRDEEEGRHYLMEAAHALKHPALRP